jgi:hypothetical protein
MILRSHKLRGSFDAQSHYKTLIFITLFLLFFLETCLLKVMVPDEGPMAREMIAKQNFK